ncbi:MAG: SPOR domain-containing protein [Aestuariivirga sp.]|nr:SPOR domain-containing protein [Aestuariivirga sp.]
MPRISGEFTKAPETIAAEATPVRPAQAVAKPAPMAPRLPMKAGTAPAAARPQQQVLPQGGPQPPDALAEKLRSQRAAAERLAEQRVTAAKQRAENAPSAPAPDPIPAKAPVAAAAPGEKPKFSFADEDSKVDFGRALRSVPPGRPPQRPAPQQPQLSPPRPPLGGQPRIPTGAPAAGFQPQYRPQPPRGYSPSAYVPPPPLSQPQRSFNGPMSQPPSGEPRLQSPRANPDGYRRGPQDDLGYAGAGYETSQRSLQQRTAALRAPAYDDDYGDEIFEDAPASRSSRRASANDYNQAYRENEGAYGDERRRSSGPWLLLLFLMLAAGAAGAGVWYYQTNVKTLAANGAGDPAPVVSAPEQSAKSAPEQPPDGQSTGAATSRKQIYDRIIGDNEVLGGQVVPSEEAPLRPEAQFGDAEQIPEPSGGFDSFSEGGDALPLPMPPPPGGGYDTQGALSTPRASNTVALSSRATATNSTSSTSTAAGTDIAPVPGETAAAATNQQATPPAAPAPATEEIVDEVPAPAVKKPPAKKTNTAAENDDDSLGAAPVVLVPPADPAAGGQIASAPIVVDQPVATQPAPVVKKKKTLLGLFRGTNDEVPAAQAAPAVPEQQVASIPQPAPIQQQAAPTEVASGGSGYFVQLASFRSQAEASTEFGRLKAKYASIIGTLPSAINPATVGGSTRYRLAVGPLASRDQATRICSSLVAAGERDCLVRRQ